MPDDELQLFTGASRFELEEFLFDLHSPEHERLGEVSIELWHAVERDLPAILVRRN